MNSWSNNKTPMKAESFRTKIQSDLRSELWRLIQKRIIHSLISLFPEYFNGQPLSLEGRNLPVTTHELTACLMSMRC